VTILDNFSGSIGWFYFAYSILVIFVQQEVDTQKIGLYSINGYPSALKFLFSPIIDTYYLNKFGKRKTYLVIISYIQFLLFMLGSLHIDE